MGKCKDISQLWYALMCLLIMGMCVCMYAYRTGTPIHACGVTVSVMPTQRSGDRPFSTLLCTGSGNTCVPEVLQHCHAFTVLQCTEIDGLCSVSVDCPTSCMAAHTIGYVRTYHLHLVCCMLLVHEAPALFCSLGLSVTEQGT